ncbi:hypothetical protein [Amedibacillus sp. YH-ame10]
MKRFLADALLICLLVSIGSYMLHKDDSPTQDDLKKQVDQFEDDIALQKEINTQRNSGTLNDIEDNAAGKLAKKSSEFVVDAIKGTVVTFSEVFDGIIN